MAALVLIWLGMSGPGFLGYGTSLLWGGLPKGEMQAVLCDQGGARQSDGAQARRPVDHARSLHGFQRAQGAIFRQVRQRVAVGTGGDAAPSRAALRISS